MLKELNDDLVKAGGGKKKFAFSAKTNIKSKPDHQEQNVIEQSMPQVVFLHWMPVM